MEESYLSFLGSYPFSSPTQHQGEEDHHVIPRPNGTPSSGLMSPDMEVPAAAPPNGTSNNYTAKKSSSACREEIGKVKQMKRVPEKKPRYAFETRSHVDLLDDGYRWRKYGQKAVKNNKFPRSYYRCTFEGCNVKKQVQRLTGDEGVVVTTYEGVHSHAIQKSNDNFDHILKQFKLYS